MERCAGDEVEDEQKNLSTNFEKTESTAFFFYKDPETMGLETRLSAKVNGGLHTVYRLPHTK
ncbi:hypothetical protein T265_02969 [Opisthorchis viverrini]|uniref:Uncharacterized protein n=1 Tax=Opisthorchis viverrini TaxID=6198 RepID=A0A075AHW9_OPIVI|nr:hypothetical protein T265_02969 [Opisthorchis viverrini]KER30614.1 hypothetical protein T265_02969 [Opisthorchis viverrini]